MKTWDDIWELIKEYNFTKHFQNKSILYVYEADGLDEQKHIDEMYSSLSYLIKEYADTHLITVEEYPQIGIKFGRNVTDNTFCITKKGRFMFQLFEKEPVAI